MKISKRAQEKAKVFTARANTIHNNKYDYSLTNYIRARDKVIIICPEHGEFTKTPNKHLMGQGCPECSMARYADNATKLFTDFIKEASVLHNNKYWYNESTYSSSKNKTEIVCPEHGIFEQTPDKHLNRGIGCPTCTKELTQTINKKSNDLFISQCQSIHGNRYNYSKVVYSKAHSNVTIICSVHGKFEQTPSNHLAGKGCKKCSQGGGFDGTKPGVLYYISIDNGKYYKIGITNRTVWERFSKDEHSRITILKLWEYPLGVDARLQESKILNLYSNKLINTKILRNGNSEIFSEDVLELDEIKDMEK